MTPDARFLGRLSRVGKTKTRNHLPPPEQKIQDGVGDLASGTMPSGWLLLFASEWNPLLNGAPTDRWTMQKNNHAGQRTSMTEERYSRVLLHLCRGACHALLAVRIPVPGVDSDLIQKKAPSNYKKTKKNKSVASTPSPPSARPLPCCLANWLTP